MATTCADPFAIVAAVLAFLLLISTVPVISGYIYAYLHGQLKTRSSLFWIGLVFFVVFVSEVTLFTLVDLLGCNEKLVDVLLSVATVVYTAQWLLLLGILFYRLYVTFKDSAICISRYTQWSFTIYYCITAFIQILNIIGLFIRALQPSVYDTMATSHLMLTGFVSFNVLLLTVLLVCLYIYKLVQVYKSVGETTRSFIPLITKTSLLFFVSALSYVLRILWMFVRIAMGSDVSSLVFIGRILALCDSGSNFLSIFLTYKYFDGTYIKLCGWLDGRCRRCWGNCIGNQASFLEKEMVETEMQSTETTEAQSADSDAAPTVNL